MSPNPTPGLYIDRLHPASCSGQITQWNFCYFNPQNFHDRDRVQIHLQVWRFNSPQRGVQVADHVVTINIPEEPEEFQCETITLDQDSYMNITEGDYLGVQLLFNRVLPVVGDSQEQMDTLVFRPLSFDLPTIVDVQEPGTVILSSNVLHVNATIGKGKNSRRGKERIRDLLFTFYFYLYTGTNINTTPNNTMATIISPTISEISSQTTDATTNQTTPEGPDATTNQTTPE